MFHLIPPSRSPSLDPTLVIYQKQSDMTSSSARENETRVNAADYRRCRWNILYHCTGERAWTFEFIYLRLSVYGNARPWTVGVHGWCRTANCGGVSIQHFEYRRPPQLQRIEISWPSPYPFQENLLGMITLRSFDAWQRHEKRDIEGFHGASPQTPKLAALEICQNLLVQGSKRLEKHHLCNRMKADWWQLVTSQSHREDQPIKLRIRGTWPSPHAHELYFFIDCDCDSEQCKVPKGLHWMFSVLPHSQPLYQSTAPYLKPGA